MFFDLDVIGAGLPVRRAVPALVDALDRDGVCVVQAPPGTGKTTLVPPAVAGLVGGRVVVTQPRRIAARAAARRLAALSGCALGQEVGFVVRGEQKTSAATRVEFCTSGVLLRRLLGDPELADVGAVVLDEVHERSIDTDLAFAMLAELRLLRPDLKLVVMSATLDATQWSRLLDDAPLVAVEAELHPLAVRWSPGPQRLDARGVAPAFLAHLADQAEGLLHEQQSTVLVFVPGARECDRVVELLTARGVVAQALHGSLDARSQDAVLRGAGGPRVVVATALAESALTVPGVRAVVDSGLAREPRWDAARGMTGLVTLAEARSSADQRAGRAARLGPGVVVRCFPQSDWPGMRAFPAPEILTADLVQTALDLAVWGSPDGEGLALPDAPAAEALTRARATLARLGAVDDQGRPTALGRRLARMPIEPRLGRALVEAAALVGSRGAAEVVAMLAGDERAPGADLVAQWRAPGGRWRQEASRLARMVSDHPRPGGLCDDDLVGTVVAAAFPERLARRRGQEYLMAAGTAAELPRESRLAGQEWLAVAETSRVGDRAVIRSAAPITVEAARRLGQGLLVEELVGSFERGRVQARRVVRLGAIELSSTPAQPDVETGRRAVAEAIQERGLTAVLGWDEAAEALRRRLALLHHQLGDPWPAMDEASLAARAEEWLGPELDRLASGRPANGLDLVSALRRLLPWPAAARLDELVPERLAVPTGSRIRLDYPADPTERVVLAVKLQECFGMVATPRLVDGRVPVLMHLLSPAQRPLAVTDDLASFWANAYPGVRAENRGRYIKHPWPEDPLMAEPRRGTTRSGR